MKKRFISLCLTLALTAAPAGAAFSDISSGSLQQTASILGSLGIMQGTGNNRFEPNRPLTRAEFCKLAVTAMGSEHGEQTVMEGAGELTRAQWVDYSAIVDNTFADAAVK